MEQKEMNYWNDHSLVVYSNQITEKSCAPVISEECWKQKCKTKLAYFASCKADWNNRKDCINFFMLSMLTQEDAV